MYYDWLLNKKKIKIKIYFYIPIEYENILTCEQNEFVEQYIHIKSTTIRVKNN